MLNKQIFEIEAGKLHVKYPSEKKWVGVGRVLLFLLLLFFCFFGFCFLLFLAFVFVVAVVCLFVCLFFSVDVYF